MKSSRSVEGVSAVTHARASSLCLQWTNFLGDRPILERDGRLVWSRVFAGKSVSGSGSASSPSPSGGGQWCSEGLLKHPGHRVAARPCRINLTVEAFHGDPGEQGSSLARSAEPSGVGSGPINWPVTNCREC